MLPTFVNLPTAIENSISMILTQQENAQWLKNAKELHSRYMVNNSEEVFIKGYSDVLAYLGLRVPSTYAQIFAALSHVHEILPSWQPTTLLDLGCGPGVGLWAASALFPSIRHAACVDREADFLTIGKQILDKEETTIDVVWQHKDISQSLELSYDSYDLVIIANVASELSVSERNKLIGRAYDRCSGILLVLEPGTPNGASTVQAIAKNFSGNAVLLAPYIGNTFVFDSEYYLHFPQRFIRPEIEKRIRHHMRDDGLAPSDWEEAKYSYVAISKVQPEVQIWGRCVGKVEKQKGFLLMPVLTQQGVEMIKVMKRHKEAYSLAKQLHWGDAIHRKEDLVVV